MGLPQHQGAFSTLRLTSPVQETSNSSRFFLPHNLHSKEGKLIKHNLTSNVKNVGIKRSKLAIGDAIVMFF
jgi:hypothetical protein